MTETTALMRLAVFESHVERRSVLGSCGTRGVIALLPTEVFLKLQAKLGTQLWTARFGSMDLLNFSRSVMENPESRFTVVSICYGDRMTNNLTSRIEEIESKSDFDVEVRSWTVEKSKSTSILSFTLLDRVTSTRVKVDRLGRAEFTGEGDFTETEDAFEASFSRYQELLLGHYFFGFPDSD